MKLRNVITGFIAFLPAMLVSCIQDEAPNVEAAIDDIKGENIQLTSIDHIRKEIEIYVLDGADISQQELNFTLAENATIKADNQESTDQPPLYDFSQNNLRRFTVTAEDGSTTASYLIRINKIELPTKYSFEELRAITPYNVFYLTNASGIIQWASGNPGYELCGMALDEKQYPTVQVLLGKEGKGVKLTTLSTGSFGQPIGMPIAAGNLFVGSFDVQNAVLAPLEATHFGFPFTKLPTRMTGWFKYKAGETMTDRSGNVIPGKKDRGDFYAALYEAPTSDFSLDGDIFPNGESIDEHIVLMARIPESQMIETDQWTYFDLEFTPQNGKTVDREALRNGKYKLAIVFSSSIMGAYFEGAVGSELWIDEVEIKYEN